MDNKSKTSAIINCRHWFHQDLATLISEMVCLVNFFSVLAEAVNPFSLKAWMICFRFFSLVTKSTQAVQVTKLTLAFRTFGCWKRVFSTALTHPLHFMPSISSKTDWFFGLLNFRLNDQEIGLHTLKVINKKNLFH